MFKKSITDSDFSLIYKMYSGNQKHLHRNLHCIVKKNLTNTNKHDDKRETDMLKV